MRELPQADRNVLSLLRAVGGGVGPTENAIEGYFAGSRISAVNVTRDGFSVSSGRYDQGTFATSYTSSDLVEEVKIPTAHCRCGSDPGFGPGGHGDALRNQHIQRISVLEQPELDARCEDWFNNFNNAKSDWQNRNQFGVRLGGPIVKNKTFFFFLIDEQRFSIRRISSERCLPTGAARNIPLLPGREARNALQTNATVDSMAIQS